MRSRQAAELVGDLAAELVERRAGAGRVEQLRQPRPVTVEVLAQDLVELAEGALALVLVEQVAGDAPQLPVVAQEALEGPGQAPVPIGEVLAQGRRQRLRRLALGRLHAVVEALELGLHDIGAQAHARVRQRQQTDAQRALGQRRPVRLGRLAHEGGKGRIGEAKPVDVDGVAGDGDACLRHG